MRSAVALLRKIAGPGISAISTENALVQKVCLYLIENILSGRGLRKASQMYQDPV